MVTKITLGEGVTFEMIYLPKKTISINGKHLVELRNRDAYPDAVTLWRYTFDRTASIDVWKYWSELETDDPQIAGLATGVESNRLWRVEWTFPISSASEVLEIGEKRWTDIGVFREYSNSVVINEGDLTWTRMRD